MAKPSNLILFERQLFYFSLLHANDKAKSYFSNFLIRNINTMRRSQRIFARIKNKHFFAEQTSPSFTKLSLWVIAGFWDNGIMGEVFHVLSYTFLAIETRRSIECFEVRLRNERSGFARFQASLCRFQVVLCWQSIW